VAFSTVDQMAGQLGVNPSTIVRFTYRLGLKGFPDLQERTRQLVRGQLSAASEIVNENSVLVHLEGTAFGRRWAGFAESAPHHLAIKAGGSASTRATSSRLPARSSWSASFNAYSVAFFLGLRARSHSRHIHDVERRHDVAGVAVPRSRPQDCLIAIHLRSLCGLDPARRAARQGARAKVIAITDTPISAVGQIADVILAARDEPAPACRNSFVAPMAIAMRCSTAWRRPTAHTRSSATAASPRCWAAWMPFLLKADDAE